MTHPLPVTQNGSHTARDVDALLRDYFRAQMPEPWPEVDVPATLPLVQPRSKWLRAFPRLALAASIVLLLLGYVALGGLFPKESTNALDQMAPEIGTREGLTPPKRVKTPRGQDALIKEQTIPGEPLPILHLQLPAGPKANR